MSDINEEALQAHEKYVGKLEVNSKVPLKNAHDMSLFYTPGVAAPCLAIAKDKDLAYKYTSKANTVAVVSDGSAVLGLGNIGAEASIPVMEGKCALFKAFSGVNAIPICLDTQDTDEIVNAIKLMAPTLGGVNLEDISAPRCFEIERRLSEELSIPIFHDDQHGTAIVCLAGLINALKIVEKDAAEVRVIISGAGAAGIAIAKLMFAYGFKHITLQDSKGLIYKGRENLNWAKEQIAEFTNLEKIEGGLEKGMQNADIFIGVSQPDIVSEEMVKSMNDKAIVFAMSNPVPEIMPNKALAAGAAVVATGRSDFPNQINNVLVFPGIFKGALEARAESFTDEMKLAAARALAGMVENPTADKIIPGVFDDGIADVVAEEVKKYA